MEAELPALVMKLVIIRCIYLSHSTNRLNAASGCSMTTRFTFIQRVKKKKNHETFENKMNVFIQSRAKFVAYQNLIDFPKKWSKQ